MLNGAGQVVSIGDGSRYSRQERGDVIARLDYQRLTSSGQELFTPNIVNAYLRNASFHILLSPSPEPALRGLRVVYKGDRDGVSAVALRHFWITFGGTPLDGSQDLVLRVRSMQGINDPRRIIEQDRITFDQLLHDLEVKYLRR